MSLSTKILKFSILFGAIYFLSISIAHFFELKIPGLFVYFDVISFEYQNKIISMLAFGWAAFFFLGFKLIDLKNNNLIILYIITGAVAIFILIIINISSELARLIEHQSTIAYWMTTIILFVYLLWILVFYIKAHKDAKK